MFESTLLFLCLTESSPFLGFSDVSSWLDYASQPECYLSDTVTLSKYHTHVEGPRVRLPLVDDVGFDCQVKGLSDLYAAEFYFSLIDTRSSSIPHTDIGTLWDFRPALPLRPREARRRCVTFWFPFA